MIISKVSGVNNKTNYSKLEGSNQVQNRNISCSRPYSTGDKVAFKGVLEGAAATIFQEALEGAAHKVLKGWKIQKALDEAEELFDRFDVKPAIELAVRMDAKFGEDFATKDLLVKAIRSVEDLSDEHMQHRDLKQRVLDHCFLDDGVNTKPDDSLPEHHELAENLLISLDPRHFDRYKKFLIEKVSRRTIHFPNEVRHNDDESMNGILNFRQIDEVLDNVRDSGFKEKMKKFWLKEKAKWDDRPPVEDMTQDWAVFKSSF